MVDEPYLACFLECVVCGSTDPERLERAKIRHILSRQPKLRSRVERAGQEAGTLGGGKLVVWRPEEDRVRNVILKMARGHAFFELNEPMMDVPDHVWFLPLHQMSKDDRGDFEALPLGDCPVAVAPEVGSRSMHRLLMETARLGGWVGVQEERYRYQVAGAGFVSVKMVIRDYLAAEVVWGN